MTADPTETPTTDESLPVDQAECRTWRENWDRDHPGEDPPCDHPTYAHCKNVVGCSTDIIGSCGPAPAPLPEPEVEPEPEP